MVAEQRRTYNTAISTSRQAPTHQQANEMSLPMEARTISHNTCLGIELRISIFILMIVLQLHGKCCTSLDADTTLTAASLSWYEISSPLSSLAHSQQDQDHDDKLRELQVRESFVESARHETEPKQLECLGKRGSTARNINKNVLSNLNVVEPVWADRGGGSASAHFNDAPRKWS